MAEHLGNYELTQRLARGGMGEVYLARQRGPGGFVREVVVKRLLPHLTEDATFVGQFLNEGRLAALVEHPNVVQVYELGEAGGTYFLAMERVRGESVRRVLRALAARKEQLPVGAAVHIVREALRGLHAAHALVHGGQPLPIIHRDVTPENLLLTRTGSVKVVDFGIARASTSGALTKTGTVKGKLPYLAPDQLQGGSASPRTDLYAVGVVLYELLTGRVPFEGETEGSLLYKILYTPPASVSKLRPEVSAALEAVVLRALAKDPAQRFTDAQEMIAALETAAAAELAALDRPALGALTGAGDSGDGSTLPTAPGDAAPAAAPAGGTAPLGAARAKSSTRVAWLGGVLLLCLLGGGGLWVLRPSASSDSSVPPERSRGTPPPEPTHAPSASSDSSAPPERSRGTPAPEPTAGSPPGTHKAAGRGKLQVFAKPWADVYWRGSKLGVTPLVEPVTLPVGAQVLTLRNDALGVKRDFKVRIRAGATTELRANLLDR